MSRDLTFYREWLSLDKTEFRILAMLADKGEFRGNLTNMCRYFALSAQTKTVNSLKVSIQKLQNSGLINHEKRGNTHILRIVPLEEGISIQSEWFKELYQHHYSAASVSWEVVTKVLLWLIAHGGQMFTNAEICSELGICESTVTAATKVLREDFEAIKKDYVYIKLAENEYRRKGQIVDISAWWA